MIMKGLKWLAKFLLTWAGSMLATIVAFILAITVLVLFLAVVGGYAEAHGNWVWGVSLFTLFTLGVAISSEMSKAEEKPKVMPRRTSIAAHTETNTGQQYPGYISINRGEGDIVNITVREGGQEGTKSVTLVVNEQVMRQIMSDVKSQLGD